VAQSAEVIQRVAGDRLAIGFAAINRISPGVKVLAVAGEVGEPPISPTEDMIRSGRYPLDRHLLIYARQPLDSFVREYLRLVFSREGQEAIAGDSLGYIPLSAPEVAQEAAHL
jgi:phosphate transport system substrate-binding protein